MNDIISKILVNYLKFHSKYDNVPMKKQTRRRIKSKAGYDYIPSFIVTLFTGKPNRALLHPAPLPPIKHSLCSYKYVKNFICSVCL